MGNPYETLGINQNATEEEIKSAYKEMVKKYHPDKYQNNPLSGLAEEKLREVNEAYEYLMKNGGSRNQGGYSSSYSSGGYGSDPEFQQVRRDLDSGRLREAEATLERMENRNAEWVFLRGMLYYKRGWHDEAISNIQQASDMAPNNMEYRQALNTLMNQGYGYQNAATGRGYRSNEDLLCTACQCYLCADCCCDCI